MRINILGGGPAGLYFALLMAKRQAGHEIHVIERNRADDTFGWGVVFSRETLGNLAETDPPSYADIEASFAYWDDIDVHYGGEVIHSTGHGFCGLSRKRLLNILQEHCRSAGVKLSFQCEVEDPRALFDADLVVAADGVNSRTREQFADRFGPSIDWRKCRFTWLGTDKVLDSFTFIFRENEHGLFQVHAYPFEPGLGTFIVECHEDVWRRAGLDNATEEETIAYCEKLFAPELQGHQLLANRSLWRAFPTVRCDRWHFDNVVLVGDAAHTAHFSIGSGTKLAMEDAIALAEAFDQHGTADVPKVLAEYENERRLDVSKTQRAAQTSLEWFEHAARYRDQTPLQFAFNLLSRSKRITYDNLALRDPALVARVDEWFQADYLAGHQAGLGPRLAQPRYKPRGLSGPVGVKAPHRPHSAKAPPPMFTPFELRGVTLRNRVVVSSMCQYSSQDGFPNDWHLVHLGSRAVGGAGLVMAEMTDISPEGRITPGCAGMYEPEHASAWRRIVDFVHGNTPAKIGMQLAHAGPKASTCLPWEARADQPLPEGNWPLISASPEPYRDYSDTPREMTRADMDQVTSEFVRAVHLTVEAGFDWLEIHMAHGYLLSAFISPLSNHRQDAYGGSLRNRMRYPLEITAAVREAWPADRPLAVRISATDWVPGGLTGDDAVEVARLLNAEGCDIVDVSAGQTSTRAQPIYGRMFQVPFSDQIRHEAGVPTIAVGNIQGADHINTVVAAGRADLCALARPHLRDPYLTMRAATDYGYEDQWWPNQYLTARPRPS